MSTQAAKRTSVAELAAVILSRTRDGEDLAPEHLLLLQRSAQRHDDAQLAREVQDLYQLVTHGWYVAPWLFGIQHLRKDHEGYVYWRDVEVEHFSFTDPDEERVEALALAHTCRELERRGIKPTSSAALRRHVLLSGPTSSDWYATILNCYFAAPLATGHGAIMEASGRVITYLKPSGADPSQAASVVVHDSGVSVVDIIRSDQWREAGPTSTSVCDGFDAYVAILQAAGVTPAGFKNVLDKHGLTQSAALS